LTHARNILKASRCRSAPPSKQRLELSVSHEYRPCDVIVVTSLPLSSSSRRSDLCLCPCPCPSQQHPSLLARHHSLPWPYPYTRHGLHPPLVALSSSTLGNAMCGTHSGPGSLVFPSALVVLVWTIPFLIFMTSHMYLYVDEPHWLVVIATPVTFSSSSSRVSTPRVTQVLAIEPTLVLRPSRVELASSLTGDHDKAVRTRAGRV
jgi:hypothetical protein